MEFEGVGAEIVEFIGPGEVDVLDVLPAFGADGRVAHFVDAGKEVVGDVFDEGGVSEGRGWGADELEELEAAQAR